MGSSLSWLAVKDRAADEVFSELGFRDTGEILDDPYDARWCWGVSHTGWLIIHSKDMQWVDKTRLALVSKGKEAVGVYVEEHVMVCGAFGFRDGAQVWALEHDLDRGVYDLGREGDPPPEFREIADRLKAEQDQNGGADYIFDVPIEMADTVAGYRHDGGATEPGEEPPPEPTFTALEAIRPQPSRPWHNETQPVHAKGKGFWSWLFGGR